VPSHCWEAAGALGGDGEAGDTVLRDVCAATVAATAAWSPPPPWEGLPAAPAAVSLPPADETAVAPSGWVDADPQLDGPAGGRTSTAMSATRTEPVVVAPGRCGARGERSEMVDEGQMFPRPGEQASRLAAEPPPLQLPHDGTTSAALAALASPGCGGGCTLDGWDGHSLAAALEVGGAGAAAAAAAEEAARAAAACVAAGAAVARCCCSWRGCGESTPPASAAAGYAIRS